MPTTDADDLGAAPTAPHMLDQLQRAMVILEAFDESRPSMTVTDAALAASTTRAAARRILLTLRDLGYLRSDGRTFSLSPRILGLGWNYFASLGFDEIARPIMDGIVAEVGETCSLATLDLPDIVYVVRSRTRQLTTIAGGVGSRLPAQSTAIGRVLLAGLDDDELAGYLDRWPLQRFTPSTVVDPGEFSERIAEVREQGWAIIDQELETGLRAIAVPVPARDGSAPAALSISSNSARHSIDDLRERFLPVLQSAALEIAAAVARR